MKSATALIYLAVAIVAVGKCGGDEPAAEQAQAEASAVLEDRDAFIRDAVERGVPVKMAERAFEYRQSQERAEPGERHKKVESFNVGNLAARD